MDGEVTLAPANDLARLNHAHFPNESSDYRTGKKRTPAEEIELRRHIERVAALRRELPPGGAVDTGLPLRGRGRPRRALCSFSATRTR